MIFFYTMKLFWKLVEIYLTKVKKLRHPIQNTFVYDTCIEAVKVVIVPTFWDNYSYIVVSGNNGVIIDPSDDKRISEEIEKRKLQIPFILITHDHIDHTSGIVKLQKKYNSTIIAVRGSLIPHNYTEFQNDSKVHFGDIIFESISVPGHYSFTYSLFNLNNNIAWHVKKAGLLFTGDTLFSCGYGCIRNGCEKTMLDSLKKIRLLQDETLIFCGHEYSLGNTTFASLIDPKNEQVNDRLLQIRRLLQLKRPSVPTALGLEKEINPFLRWDDKRLRSQLHMSGIDDLNFFMHLRKMKNDYNLGK